MILLDVLGWLAFVLNVWGNLALTKLSARGFVIRLVCNAVWIAYAVPTGAWPLLGNHAVFAAINVYGWWTWTNERRAEARGWREQGT